DLELQTFKVVDPLSGRLLGVRADITPQVARIDAHVLNESGATRLCYAGSVLRTMTAVPGATREVFQVGAELFGEPGIDGDREVVTLMISSLAAAGLTGLHLDLGHVGVYRALAHGAGIANEEGDLFVAIAAITITTARYFPCSPPVSRPRSATADATTASARRSAGRVLPPDSRSTCAS